MPTYLLTHLLVLIISKPLSIFDPTLLIHQTLMTHFMHDFSIVLGKNKSNLQGISYKDVTSNLGLTDRNMHARVCLKLILKFRGLEILVSTTSF